MLMWCNIRMAWTEMGLVVGEKLDPRAAVSGPGGLFDRNTWREASSGWARSVVTGRARLAGVPVGEPPSPPSQTNHQPLNAVDNRKPLMYISAAFVEASDPLTAGEPSAPEWTVTARLQGACRCHA